MAWVPIPIEPPATVKSSAPTKTGRPSIAPAAGDEGVGGRAVGRADEGADLAEGARIEQRGDALARVETAAGMLARALLRAAHRLRGRAAAREFIEQRFPVRAVGHRVAHATP